MHGRDPLSPVDQRHLPEEPTGTDGADLVAVDRGGRVTLDHHVELVALVALARDLGSRRHLTGRDRAAIRESSSSSHAENNHTPRSRAMRSSMSAESNVMDGRVDPAPRATPPRAHDEDEAEHDRGHTDEHRGGRVVRRTGEREPAEHGDGHVELADRAPDASGGGAGRGALGDAQRAREIALGIGRERPDLLPVEQDVEHLVGNAATAAERRRSRRARRRGSRPRSRLRAGTGRRRAGA